MDIIDFLKDVNHWGVLAVCVYGIIVFMSSLFKNSVNEKVRISMTVVAVTFLAGIIIWVLFFGNESKKELTTSNPQVHNDNQLALMEETALRSLDVKEREIRSLQDKNSALERQIASLSRSRDNFLGQLALISLERDKALNSLDIKAAELLRMKEKQSDLEKQNFTISANRDYLAKQLKQEEQNAVILTQRLETAIASLDKLNSVAKPLTQNSTNKPGWLGVEIVDGFNGVIVDAIFHGSPAEKAGIKPGDVISEFNGVHIKSVNDFEHQFSKLHFNEYVRIFIIRNNTALILNVKLEEYKE